MSETITLYKDTARELKTGVRAVYGYCRKGLLERAYLPGFRRARGVTRASLNRLLDRIASCDAGKVVGDA